MAVLRRIHFPEQVKAETEVRIPLFFDAPIKEMDKTILQCHIYDEIFNIDYYLPDISIGSLEAPNLDKDLLRWMPIDTTYLPHIRIAKLKFPEQLAGGIFLVEFLVQCFPSDLIPTRHPYEIAVAVEKASYADEVKAYLKEKMKDDIDRLLNRVLSDSPPTSKTLTFPLRYYDVRRNHFQSNVKVESGVPQSPKVVSVCWGEDENIRFREPSKHRTNTKVGKNETLFLHIQTRGLYGQEIPTSIGKVRIKDNTAVAVGQLWYWASLSKTFFFDSTSKRINGFAGLYQKNKDGSLDTQHFNLKSIVYATPQLTYDSQCVTPISPATSAVTVSVGGQIKPKIYSEARCMVEFRPSSAYQGDFGFSWFRKGDLQLRGNTYSRKSNRLDLTINTLNVPSNDQDFAEIMGHHYESVTVGNNTVEYFVQNGNNSSKHSLFKKDEQMYRNHSLDYYRILMRNVEGQEYHIPYMTIRKGVEAELSLHITIKEQPEKLVYRFDNPKALSEGYMTINGSSAPYEDSAPPEKTGNSPDIARTIRIKCLREFSKPLRFEVYAKVKDSEEEHLCGAVHIFPNDILHQRKIHVVFFNVVTKINGKDPQSGIAENDTSKLDTLKKYLGQAYVVPEITIEKLKLIDETTGVTDAGYLACCEDTDGDGIKDMVYSRKYKLEDFLTRKLENLGMHKKYKNYFKIFFYRR